MAACPGPPRARVLQAVRIQARSGGAGVQAGDKEPVVSRTVTDERMSKRFPQAAAESMLMGPSAGDAPQRTAAMTGVPRRHCRAHSGLLRCPSMRVQSRVGGKYAFAGPRRKPKKRSPLARWCFRRQYAVLDDQVKNSSFDPRFSNQIAFAPSDYVQCGLHFPVDLLPPRHEPILSAWIVSRRFPGV